MNNQRLIFLELKYIIFDFTFIFIFILINIYQLQP